MKGKVACDLNRFSIETFGLKKRTENEKIEKAAVNENAYETDRKVDDV